jgi:hypothetical protein
MNRTVATTEINKETSVMNQRTPLPSTGVAVPSEIRRRIALN